MGEEVGKRRVNSMARAWSVSEKSAEGWSWGKIGGRLDFVLRSMGFYSDEGFYSEEYGGQIDILGCLFWQFRLKGQDWQVL